MCSKESSVTCYTGGTLSGTTYFASQDDTDRCGYGGTISGGTTVSASSGGNGGWGRRRKQPPVLRQYRTKHAKQFPERVRINALYFLS